MEEPGIGTWPPEDHCNATSARVVEPPASPTEGFTGAVASTKGDWALGSNPGCVRGREEERSEAAARKEIGITKGDLRVLDRTTDQDEKSYHRR